MTDSVDTDRQEQLVLYGYAMQWSMLVIPPMFLVSLVYSLLVRRHVTHFEIRTHVTWQLATCLITVALLGAAVLLLVVGMSGVHTDAPLSVIATFALMGGSALFLPWLFYRLIYGSLRLSRQEPMRSALL